MDNVKTIAEIIALLSAGVFFGYKALTGYLRSNLSLFIECERHNSHTNDKDDLVVILKLKKGANGSLTLHDAQAWVSHDVTDQFLSFKGVERSAMKIVTDTLPRRIIDWSEVNVESPLLKIVPGEETQLSVVCTVPAKAICSVEIAVLGQRTNGRPFGQWKASSVSLPRAV